MLSGVAIDAAASMRCDASSVGMWVVACSASALLTIVPLLDQPTAASVPPLPPLPPSAPPSRVARRWRTASRRSSLAPRYAEKSRGDVTGESPHARMLITATCQPRSAAVAAIERTYVSCEPPPSPLASSSIGRSGSSGGGSSTKVVKPSSSAAPGSAPPVVSELGTVVPVGLLEPRQSSDCSTRRMPASRSTASVPPSGVGTSCRWYLTARVLRSFAARIVCTWPLATMRGCAYHESQLASSGTRASTVCVSGCEGSECTPSMAFPSDRRDATPGESEARSTMLG